MPWFRLGTGFRDVFFVDQGEGACCPGLLLLGVGEGDGRGFGFAGVADDGLEGVFPHALESGVDGFELFAEAEFLGEGRGGGSEGGRGECLSLTRRNRDNTHARTLTTHPPSLPPSPPSLPPTPPPCSF